MCEQCYPNVNDYLYLTNLMPGNFRRDDARNKSLLFDMLSIRSIRVFVVWLVEERGSNFQVSREMGAGTLRE